MIKHLYAPIAALSPAFMTIVSAALSLGGMAMAAEPPGPQFDINDVHMEPVPCAVAAVLPDVTDKFVDLADAAKRLAEVAVHLPDVAPLRSFANAVDGFDNPVPIAA